MPTWSGTAWALNENGDVVTAYHVVKGGHVFAIRINDNLYYGKVIATDPGNDVAILHFNMPDLGYLPLQVTFKDGEVAAVYGYPHPDVFGTNLKVSFGHLFHTDPNSGDNGSGIIMTTDYAIGDTFVCPGNSGGPVYGTYGVVGLLDDGVAPFGVLNCSALGAGPTSIHVAELADKNHILFHIGNVFINPIKPLFTDGVIYQIIGQ